MATSQSSGAVVAGAAMSAGIFCNQGNFFSVPAEVLPRRYRGIGATITVSAGGFGALLSLMFTGATVTNNTGGLSWRSGYILGACIHVIAATLLIFFYRPLESPKEPGVSTWAILRKKIDWLGAFILAAAIGLFMTGLTMGGESYAWDSGYVIGTLCAGAGMMIVLAIHQIFFNKHGILDHDLWTRNFGVAAFGCFVEGVVFLSILLFFPLETSILWETRVYYQNARLLAFFATSAVVAPFVGYYTRHTRDLKNPLLAGWTIVLIGMIILATIGASAGKTSIGAVFLCGVGFATPLALLFAVAQLATPPHLLGLTTGQLISARAIGQAVGASVLVAVFKAKVASILPAEVSAAALKAGLPESSLPALVGGISTGNTTLIMSAPGVTLPIIEAASAAATDSYVRSFHYGWDTALPFVAIALLIVFALDGPKIKSQMTWLIERPVSLTFCSSVSTLTDPRHRLQRSIMFITTRSMRMERERDRCSHSVLGESPRPFTNRMRGECIGTQHLRNNVCRHMKKLPAQPQVLLLINSFSHSAGSLMHLLVSLLPVFATI